MGKDEDLRHGHRKRMKEQFALSERGDEFPDYQLLEMLLFYALPRVDTRQTAKELINECGSLAGVFNADVEKLKKKKYRLFQKKLWKKLWKKLFLRRKLL